jgi:hypothetical protein
VDGKDRTVDEGSVVKEVTTGFEEEKSANTKTVQYILSVVAVVVMIDKKE